MEFSVHPVDISCFPCSVAPKILLVPRFSYSIPCPFGPLNLESLIHSPLTQVILYRGDFTLEATCPPSTALLTPGGNLEDCFQRHFQKTAQILLLQSDPCPKSLNCQSDQEKPLVALRSTNKNWEWRVCLRDGNHQHSVRAAKTMELLPPRLTWWLLFRSPDGAGKQASNVSLSLSWSCGEGSLYPVTSCFRVCRSNYVSMPAGERGSNANPHQTSVTS